MAWFTVELIGSAEVACCIRVEAETQEEAEVKATPLATDWQISNPPDSIQVINCEEE